MKEIQRRWVREGSVKKRMRERDLKGDRSEEGKKRTTERNTVFFPMKVEGVPCESLPNFWNFS